ncbi:hypothetical protein V9T40_006987 [Parthenolecanium corni]|uniref:Uncharacterized protein n=1 Tax=Parthenolecanium corni TaxID=536013 RepID=A0AAN9U325_9HEMI
MSIPLPQTNKKRRRHRAHKSPREENLEPTISVTLLTNSNSRKIHFGTKKIKTSLKKPVTPSLPEFRKNVAALRLSLTFRFTPFPSTVRSHIIYPTWKMKFLNSAKMIINLSNKICKQTRMCHMCYDYKQFKANHAIRKVYFRKIPKYPEGTFRLWCRCTFCRRSQFLKGMHVKDFVDNDRRLLPHPAELGYEIPIKGLCKEAERWNGMRRVRDIKRFEIYDCAMTANPKYEMDRHDPLINQLSRTECTKCCGRKYLPDGVLPPSKEYPLDEEL